MEIRETIPDQKIHYFFTMILQPFIWNFPLTVVHLSKSVNGSFSINEVQYIMVLSRLINAHPNFEMHYFAADGTDSLNKFHETAFNSYEKYVNNVINGKLILEDFLKYIIEYCIILPILDMFHGVKAGRNRIIDNILKLGRKSFTEQHQSGSYRKQQHNI